MNDTEQATIAVTVFGPNLTHAGQGKGDMHVHAADCGDAKHYGAGTKYGGDGGWTIEASSEKDVVFAIYDPDDFGYDEADWESYGQEVYFAPCVKFGSSS